MQPTIIGFLVAGLGVLAIFGRPTLVVTIALLLTLLGAGAAINLPALGGASILAGPFFTGFIILRTLMVRGGLGRFLNALTPPSAGFWLLLAIVYGVIAAFFIAPFYYNEILVFPISRGADGESSFAAELLRFSSGNLTQSVYAIGQVLLFAAICATVHTVELRNRALDALIVLCVAHVALSVLDMATFYTGTSVLIDWLRSSNYITWQGATVAGLKRISALFPEASLYSIYGMTITGIMLSLTLSRYRITLTMPLFVASLLLLVISTSSTAYVALGIAVPLLALIALKQTLFLQSLGLARILVLGALGALLMAIAVVVVYPAIIDQAGTLIDETLVSKLDSDSGVDRSRLNEWAFSTFQETSMLGVGIGGARTSSFAMTLLSNLGLAGTLLYLAFIGRTFLGPSSPDEPRTVGVLRRAACWGMVGGLIGACVSLSIFDLGPLFYILAALATPLATRRATAARRRPRRRGLLPPGQRVPADGPPSLGAPAA